MGLIPRSVLAAAGVLSIALLQVPVSGQGPAAPGPADPGKSLGETYRFTQSRVEFQKVAAFKAFDNLFYVGPAFTSVWLIPTTEGLILIDSAQEPFVDHIISGIRKFGFEPKDIKYILLSHGHLDHFGGAVRLKEMSGARVGALDADWKLIDEAAKRPPRAGATPALFPAKDLVLEDGQTITLGTTTLKVYKTSGHTEGTASFQFTVYDNGKALKAFSFGGPGPREGVAAAKEFLASVRRIRAELSDVEVPVHIHSYLQTYDYPGGTIFERTNKLPDRKPGDPHPLVDNASWRQWLQTAEAGTLASIEERKVTP